MERNLLYGMTTLAEILIGAVRRHGPKVAFVDERGDLTYQALAGRVSQTIAVFKELGIAPGDTVAQLAGNRAETFIVMMACYVFGAKSVALHPLGGDSDQAYVLKDSEARLVIVDGQYAERIERIRADCAETAHWFSHDPETTLRHFWKDADAMPVSELRAQGNAEDIVRIAYTGGTTGRPKGVMLSNRSLVTYVMLALSGISWPDDVRLLCTTPITHAAGSLILPTLARGGSVLLHQGFAVDRFIAAVETQRCNVTFMVPTLIYALLDDGRARHADWSEMHAMIYGAAPMSPKRVREALEVLGPCLVQVYGQTESPNLVLTLTQRDHVLANDGRLASAGRPLVGLTVALLDEAGQEIGGNGEVGEICVRGPLLMSGYWGQPDATESAFEGDWLHTGDMAHRDEQGYYYLVDRKKDLIISGGFNVYPKEVEDVLAAHPAVATAAVIGVPDAKWGEAVKAFVVLRPGLSADANELIAMVRQARGAVHAPKSVEFATRLPLTALGKVDKKALRAPYWTDANRAIH